MKELNGVPVSQGILIGKAVVIKRQELDCPRHFIHAKSTGREIKRLEKAISKSKNQLTRHIRGLRHDEYGFFEVLNAHLLMMDDVEFLDRIKAIISERLQNAEWALQQVSRELVLAMGEATDPYLRARAEDIQHVSNRVMANLCGIKADPDAGKLRGAVVVAHAISPGNLARMVKQGLAGMVVDVGGETSHAAIIARALGIPAVVGMGNASTSVKDGDKVILDGLRGKLVMDPTEQQIEEYKEVRQRFMAFEDELLSDVELPAETKDGFITRLSGNLETEDELDELLSHGAEGLALVRTEFLYLGSASEPDEETQYQAYSRIIKRIGKRVVTFRTLDLGGEKFPSYLPQLEEENPALGLRAIRYCMTHPKLFTTQLRALLRASIHGNIRIMFPLITGVSELRAVKEFYRKVQEELRAERIPFKDDIPIGAMIELPSAAIVADLLAQEVDFFSIGTNDLIQYTMAIDRLSEHLRKQYHPMHIAILRLLRMITTAAQNNGVDVSLCGEMAGNPMYAPLLVAMGISELGMSAVAIPHVKRLIRSIRLSESRELLGRVMECDGFEAIEELINQEIGERFPELCYKRF